MLSNRITIRVLYLFFLLFNLHYYCLAEDKLPEVFSNIGITEKIGEKVYIESVLYNSNGNKTTLASEIGSDKPTILAFVYYKCPMLCHLLLDGILESIKTNKTISLGIDYQVIAISMAKEDTLDDLKSFQAKYHQDLSEIQKKNLKFYISEENDIKRITESTGFAYKYVKETDDYAHQAALIFINKQKIISRYLYGIRFEENNIKKALIESTDNDDRNIYEKAIMFCYQYNPDKNSYTLHAINLMRISCLLTVLILVIILFNMRKQEKKDLNYEK